MKNLDDIAMIHNEFERIYGVSVRDAQQNSGVWTFAKLGVVSASKAKEAVGDPKSGGRNTYLQQLVAQVCTGIFSEMNMRVLEWGHDNEDRARAEYELVSGREVIQLPFIYKDLNFREGCSPDGITSDRCVEIKCPYTSDKYTAFVTAKKLDRNYEWQMQYQMRVMDADACDIVMYDPRMKKKPICYRTVERNDKMQAQFDERIPEFIADMDKALEKIGIRFGEQWAAGVQ